MMKYELEKVLSLLLPPRRCRCHHHHSLFCAAAAAIIVEASSRSRSAPVVAGTRRHKRALEASSAKIVTKVKMIEVCNRHRTCDVQIWSQALTQLSYLNLFEVREKCFFVVNFTSSHDWDFTFNFKRLRQR